MRTRLITSEVVELRQAGKDLQSIAFILGSSVEAVFACISEYKNKSKKKKFYAKNKHNG